MHGVCGRMDDLGLLVLQGTHTARCASPLSAFILALFHRGIKHPEGVFIIFLQIVCRHPSYFCRSAAAVHRTAYHTRTVMPCRTNALLCPAVQFCPQICGQRTQNSQKSPAASTLNCTTAHRSCIIEWVFLGAVCGFGPPARPQTLNVFSEK